MTEAGLDPSNWYYDQMSVDFDYLSANGGGVPDELDEEPAPTLDSIAPAYRAPFRIVVDEAVPVVATVPVEDGRSDTRKRWARVRSSIAFEVAVMAAASIALTLAMSSPACSSLFGA